MSSTTPHITGTVYMYTCTCIIMYSVHVYTMYIPRSVCMHDHCTMKCSMFNPLKDVYYACIHNGLVCLCMLLCTIYNVYASTNLRLPEMLTCTYCTFTLTKCTQYASIHVHVGGCCAVLCYYYPPQHVVALRTC